MTSWRLSAARSAAGSRGRRYELDNAGREIRKVLLVSLSNLGDIILTTPVFTRIAGCFPGARIDVLCGAPGRDVFAGHPSAGEIRVPSRGRELKARLAEARRVRREGYDMVIDLKRSLLPYISGAPRRSRLFRAIPGDIHKTEEHLSALAGVHPFFSRPDAPGGGLYLPSSSEDEREADSAVNGAGPLVVVNPGAKSHLKRWPAGHFSEVIDGLAVIEGISFILTGAEEDREAVDNVRSSSSCHHVTDLCGKTSLAGLAAVLRRADLVITNDSAPLHASSAVNAPVVAVFGPTDEKKYGPLSNRSRVCRPGVPCRPCGRAQCSLRGGDGCIGDVTPGEVLAACFEILNMDAREGANGEYNNKTG